MSECSHTEDTSTYIEEHMDDWGETVEGEWEYSTKSTLVDIDLHRYQCTQCGEVFYYSEYGRSIYDRS